MRSFVALLLLAMLLGVSLGQQICLHRECAKEIAGCDAACVALMGKCTFACTLNSLGCLEKCMWDTAPAMSLLQCSFNKCIYV